MDRIFICIDLKSFYASVECVHRGLDPLKARLLVADESRYLVFIRVIESAVLDSDYENLFFWISQTAIRVLSCSMSKRTARASAPEIITISTLTNTLLSSS